jgi:tetratricopeptide (TPR) repeat protein
MAQSSANPNPTVRLRRRWLVVGTVVLLGLGCAGAWYFWSQYYLGAAERALGRYDFTTARRHLDQYLRIRPKDERAQLLAIQTSRRSDDHADAERLLTVFEQTFGETDASRREWRLLGVQQGDMLDDERGLQALVERNDPESSLILEALAKGYMNSLRWSQMIGCLDRWLEREPGNAAALVLRGQGRIGLRQLERAAEDYQRAVELAPEYDAARLGLAEIQYRIGHPREAITHYEILRRRQPTHPESALGLARSLFDAAEPDQARQVLDELLTAHPEHGAALVERGNLALRRGQPAEAETFLARAVATAPWDRQAHQYRLLALEALGRGDEARKCQERIGELEARDAEMGRLATRFEHAPDDPDVRCHLGQWFLDNGQKEIGVRWLFAALRSNPRHGPTRAALADYFERSGQPRRAAVFRRGSAAGS